MNVISNKKFYISVGAITLFVACLPLFTLNCIGGHDIAYHLLRIEALKAGILAGRPFLRINMLFFGGMGYASSLFYPDLFLYFPAVLRLLGVGINLSYHLFVALCIVLGFFSCFYCARYISGNSYSAMISAVIFTLYQYHIYDIYTRGAAGEFTAVIFVPFVIAGLYDFIFGEFSKPWFLFVGMTGVLLCHTITAVVCILLCVLAVITDIKEIIRKPLRIIKLILTALLTLGVTAFYWMSVLEMLSTGAFSRDFYFNTSYEASKLWEIFYNDYNRMGVAVFVLLLSGLLIKKRGKFANLCMAAGVILTICATGIFPWKRFEGLLGFIQFPWRLFVITGPLLAIAEGLYLSRFAEELVEGKEQNGSGNVPKIIMIVVLSVMCVSVAGNFQHNTEKNYSYSSDYFDYVPFTAEVIGGEWLPTAVSDREALIEQSDKSYTDDGVELPVRRIKNEVLIDSIPYGTEFTDVPFIFYKGYAAYDTETGELLTVTGEGRNGTVRVYTDGADHIRVWYKGTLIQHIADAVSICTITGILVWILISKTIKKRDKADNER